MLIVVEKEFEDDVSYISEGIIKFAKTNHATVHYHPYGDIGGAIALCETFLETVAARIRVERLYGRRA